MVGDVNRDGFIDVFASNENATGLRGETRAGKIGIYSGKDGTLLFIKYGSNINSKLGESPILIDNLDRNKAFEVLVRFNKIYTVGDKLVEKSAIRAYSSKTGEVLFERNGEETDDFGGGGLDLFDDVNGDGKKDIIVRSPNYSRVPGANDKSGAIHIISGKDGTDLHVNYGGSANTEFGKKFLIF